MKKVIKSSKNKEQKPVKSAYLFDRDDEVIDALEEICELLEENPGIVNGPEIPELVDRLKNIMFDITGLA